MPYMTHASTDISILQLVSPHIEAAFRPDFEIRRRLPKNLQALDAIAANFYWSWQPDGVALFREIDPEVWERFEQHPKSLLKNVSELRLWQKSLDTEYVERLQRFKEKFDAYLIGARHDHGTAGDPSTDHPIAYFCAEYGIHNSLPNYSGGLGILAGDHLKSASDLDIPLVAIGLLYRFGYFRQDISHDGWQQERYHDIFGTDPALTPVLDHAGHRVTVCVHIRGREVFAQAWHAWVGRISLYLLDTNVPENRDVDRFITGHLYGGDTETRIVQEKVLGIGGVRLLRKLRISPSVFHLNEGHSAFLTLELAKEHLESIPDHNFADAATAGRKQCVFTTHTPVAAGNDMFEPAKLVECFSSEYIAALKLTNEEFLALGRANLADDTEYFGMTPLAIRMCRSANGVSAKHGEVSRSLWHKMFPDIADASSVPITSVTNGVHAPTWIAPVFQALYEERLGSNWPETARSKDDWAAAVSTLSDDEIWNAHLALKNLLIAFIRERTLSKETGLRDTIHERWDTKDLFSPEVLTIGFARRVAAYKRWDLIFSDLPRLLKMVDDPDRPVQFVFAGKAHPQDLTAKTILQELMSINHQSNWQKRAVFVQDYDQEVARHLVQGVDVWMNVPRRPYEASGTSGMKAAMNGVLNFSILDGWWIEGFNGENGFSIGGLDAGLPEDEMDAADGQALYDTLESQVIPAYYSKLEDGPSTDWVGRMRNSIATLTPQFSSDRMVRDYLETIYIAETGAVRSSSS
ncbi:MAG TPA: alpha-glucan family phosphorylase [Pyrinomonadaceae bacterium]|nr:alpha-glucan family phosphorylase [Pyrinomonadaceae bacterium]